MPFSRSFSPFNASRRVDRRWMRLQVSPEYLVDMGKSTEWVTIRVESNPLPEDARCIGVEADMSANAIYLIIESASYPLLAEEGITPAIMQPPMWAQWFGPGEPPKEGAQE